MACLEPITTRLSRTPHRAGPNTRTKEQESSGEVQEHQDIINFARLHTEWFFGHPFADFQLVAVGRIWRGRLYGDSGPRCHRDTHQVDGSRQCARSNTPDAQHSGHNAELQNTRMAIAPNGHHDRDHTSHSNIRNNVQLYCSVITPTP